MCVCVCVWVKIYISPVGISVLPRRDPIHQGLYTATMSAADAVFSAMASAFYERAMVLTSPGVEDRSLLVLSSSISMEDIETYNALVSHLIDVNDQPQLFRPTFMTKIVQRLDAANDFKLSAEELAKARNSWARDEADKVRILYSYFKSLTRRSVHSRSTIIARLKLKYFEKHGATDQGDGDGAGGGGCGSGKGQGLNIPVCAGDIGLGPGALDDMFDETLRDFSGSESDEPSIKLQQLPDTLPLEDEVLPDTLPDAEAVPLPGPAVEGSPSVLAPEDIEVLSDDGGDAEVLDVGDPAGDDDAALQNGVGHLNLAPRPTDLAKLISDAEVSCREAVADTIGHHKKKIAATEPSAKRLKGKQPTPEKRPPPPDSTFDTPAKRRASPKQTPEKGAAPATSPSTSPDKSAIEDRLWPATLQEFNNATATRVAGIQLMGKIAGIVALSKLEFSDPEISIALERDVLSVLNSDVLSGDFEHIFVKLVLKKERGKIIFQLKNTQNKAICQTIAPAAEPDAVEQAYMTAMVLSWIAAAGGGKDALRVAKALINACPAN